MWRQVFNGGRKTGSSRSGKVEKPVKKLARQGREGRGLRAKVDFRGGGSYVA